MYSTPKKNIQAFIDAKNQEIQALKKKIMTEKVTYQEMEIAKNHLGRLKQAQFDLSGQSFDQLKNVLRGSHQAVSELVQKKNYVLKELQMRKKESQQMSELMKELQSKGQKAEQILKETSQIKFKLEVKKDRKNQEILDSESELSILQNQISMEKQIDRELQQGQEDMTEKKDELNSYFKATQNQNKKLQEQISIQIDHIKALEHNIGLDKLKEQNLELKIENQIKICQNSQQKIDTAQNFLQKFAEDKLFYLGESEVQKNIDELLENCSDNNNKKHKEKQHCESQIDDLTQKISNGKVKKGRTQIELEEKMGALKELKEKTFQLKNILNSIFQEDSTVMKLISDKKVYPSLEKENVQKNSEKMNTNQENQKPTTIEQQKTSQNFFQSITN